MKSNFLIFVSVLPLALVPFGAQAQEADEELLARGTYLMESIVACGNCHTPKSDDLLPREDMKLAGGYVITEPGFVAYAPNITMDEETGIGTWTDEEIIVAIRDGLRPDGTLLGPPMPSPFYRGMSDYDARAIVAYMRAQEPIRNVVPLSEYNIPLPPNYGPPVGSVPDVPRDDPLVYGEYLAGPLGHCFECHTKIFEGRHDFENSYGLGGNVYNELWDQRITTVSTNITPHPTLGIGEWSDEEIKTAIQQGVRPDGRELVHAMGFPYYENITDEDMDALIVYLRSIPPLPAE